MRKEKKRYLQKGTAHRALIETLMLAPYTGAKKKLSYRLIVVDEELQIFHVSCYETMREAEAGLMELGGAIYPWAEEKEA